MRYLKNSRPQYTRSPFKKGVITCPVCLRKTDYHCRVTEDGGLAYCRNIPSDRPRDEKGRYQHILRTDSARNQMGAASQAKTEKTETRKADADTLDKVYSALLERLELKPEHGSKLFLARCLSDRAVEENSYATCPNKDEADEIVKELSELFDLAGVPGFYTDNDSWRLKDSHKGFYVPYRDEKGRIVGLQIRQDWSANPKYLWLSSNNLENGTSSGAPLHFVNPGVVRQSKTVYITEGALKADVIGDRMNVGVVAIAGVSVVTSQKLADSIFSAFPDLEKVVLAFDADWKENEAVKNALLSLLGVLKERNVTVDVAVWNAEFGKGLDDVLNYGKIPPSCHLPADEIPSSEEIVSYVPAQEFLKMVGDEESEKSDSLESSEIEEQSEAKVEQELIADEDEFDDFATDEESIAEGETDTLGITWGDFSRIRFAAPERVMFGLYRGNVGALVASTDIGKTTLMLNLAVSACSERPFEPLLNEQTVGKRILYIDGEATKAELQADLKKMLRICSPAQRELLKDRLCLICDEELSGEPLDLVNCDHIKQVEEVASKFKPDLIIVDTLSALANLEDENDNAKVKKEIIQPLKTLARKTNSAVLILHHTGKFIEGSPQAQDPYKGRGASAFGALSRVVLNLKDQKGKVVLSCSKVKGGKFQDVVMELDPKSRWFKLSDEPVAKTESKGDKTYWKVVKFVLDAKKPLKLADIVKDTGMKDSTVRRNLAEAIKKGDLIRSDYGYYSAPNRDLGLAN